MRMLTWAWSQYRGCDGRGWRIERAGEEMIVAYDRDDCGGWSESPVRTRSRNESRVRELPDRVESPHRSLYGCVGDPFQSLASRGLYVDDRRRRIRETAKDRR